MKDQPIKKDNQSEKYYRRLIGFLARRVAGGLLEGDVIGEFAKPILMMRGAMTEIEEPFNPRGDFEMLMNKLENQNV